jgi:transcriptional regulator with XRE-family HTH domain
MDSEGSAAVRALGARIARRRRELSLSQADLADRLGLASPETVSRYERGEREPRFTTLLRLSDALEWSVRELLSGHEAPAAHVDSSSSNFDHRLAELVERDPIVGAAARAAIDHVLALAEARRGDT